MTHSKDAPRLLVAPTTHRFGPSTLIGIAGLRSPSVVGSRGGTRRPAEILAAAAAGHCPDLIVFSDQLVSAEDAPLPVLHEGALRFLPALEAILHVQHGYLPHFWTDTGVLTPPQPGFEAVLRCFPAYLASCDRLGEEWLARALQPQRLASERLGAAAAEIRRLQDAALHAYARARRPVDAPLREVLTRTDSALRHLRAA